jgi:glycosyltransferase involved in cell wall biosynthesis
MEENPPKVSVLIVTYNHERYLRAALESALAQQTSFDVEVVVGEDCSTDGTRGIIEEFRAKPGRTLRALYRPANLGLAQNLRLTWEACRGQYIAILEGDDYWTDPQKLQRQADALDAHADWALCFHRVEVIEDGSPPRLKTLEPAEDSFPDETSLDDLLRRNFISNVSVMYRRGLIEGIPDSFAGLVQQDFALHALHALRGKIGYLSETMAVWRHHAGSMWSAQSECRRVEWILQAYEVVQELVGPSHRHAIADGRVRLLRQICEDREKLANSRDYRLGHALLRPIRAIRGRRID